MEFDLTSPSLLDRLNSMSYKSNTSPQSAESTSTHQIRQAPILTSHQPEMLSDAFQQMLDRSINELKDLLTDICTEGNTLLQNFQENIPNSNLKRLESMIPRLNDASTKLVRTLTPNKNASQSLNVKRELEIKDEDDDDLIEMKPAINGYKKVKQSPSQSDGPEVILVGTAFSIKFICHAEIQGFLPLEKQNRYSYWPNDGKESSLTIKREDFVSLPSHATLRMSKEHAKITATRNGDRVNYELTDLSVNGIHYLGNRIDGTVKERPVKLQKGIPFKLKDGDWICLLLKKDAKGPEVLLGFEFVKN